MSKFVLAAGMMFVASILGAAGQMLFKKADVQFSAYALATNWFLIAGMAIYGVGLVLNLLAYRYGQVSLLYSFLAFSYVFVAVFAAFFLGEQLTWNKLAGAGVIVAGVTMMNWGVT